MHAQSQTTTESGGTSSDQQFAAQKYPPRSNGNKPHANGAIPKRSNQQQYYEVQQRNGSETSGSVDVS